MQQTIIAAGIAVVTGMALIVVPALADKRQARKVRKAERAEQRAQKERAEAFYDFLEVAAEARKANPENYQPGQVPGVGKDGIYLV